MKKNTTLTLLFLLLVIPLTTTAQQSDKDAAIARIRKAYNAAVANAKMIEKDKVTMTKNGCWGPENSRTAIDFYYTLEAVEDADMVIEKLNLVRETQKGTYTTYYQEFLFDPETETLLFNLVVSDNKNESIKVERRTYFGVNEDGTTYTEVKVIDKKTGKDVTSKYSENIGLLMDDGFMVRYGHNLVNAFSNIMLRGWD